MRANARNVASWVWHPDVTPSGLDAGYERGDGVGGLSVWNPAGALSLAETSFGLSSYGGGGPRWAIPSTQWSITTYAGYSGARPSSSVRTAGIYVAEDIVGSPTTANFYRFVLEVNSTITTEAAVYVQTWSQWGSFTSNISSITTGLGWISGLYMRVSSNGVATGSSWYLSISFDGLTFTEIASGTWSTLAGGALYRGVMAANVSGSPAVYPWVRNRSSAIEYRAPHIEGGIIT